MRSRLRKAQRWLDGELRWHRWAVGAWRELRRRPVEVGTLSNEEIDRGGDWSAADTTEDGW